MYVHPNICFISTYVCMHTKQESKSAKTNNGFNIFKKFTTGRRRHVRSDGPLATFTDMCIYIHTYVYGVCMGTIKNEFSNVNFVKKNYILIFFIVFHIL